MKRLAVVLSVFSVALFLSCPNTAFAITFDLTDSSGGYVFTEGGLTLTVSASWDGAAASVTRNGYGYLGVSANGTTDSDLLDGTAGIDALHFSFGQEVLLREVCFRYGTGDEFRLLSDTGFDLVGTADSVYNQFSEDLSGSVISISAFENDSFRIKQLTVDIAPPAPTPEPSTWLMMTTGLLGLVCLRRKNAV